MNDKNNNDILFFRVWRNIVINRVIFNHSRLYIKNKEVKFIDIQKLREYSEREYITKLKYEKYDGLLCKGDLPEYGVLKELDLSDYHGPITCGDIVPQGVEIIRFIGKTEIQLSELPSSIQTLLHITLKKPYTNNTIPNNITSLSFNRFIDPNEFYDIVLPSSLKKLDLISLDYIKSKLPCASTSLSSSFIPSSVTDLRIWYDERFKSNLPTTIPSSVVKLKMYFSDKCFIKKGFIPFGVKKLLLNGSYGSGGIDLSENSLPESITKLVIILDFSHWGIVDCIKPFSIPNSVLSLNIFFTSYPKSFNDMFPNSLTSLEIDSRYNTNPPPSLSELPCTLKYLKIGNKEIDLDK